MSSHWVFKSTGRCPAHRCVFCSSLFPYPVPFPACLLSLLTAFASASASEHLSLLPPDCPGPPDSPCSLFVFPRISPSLPLRCLSLSLPATPRPSSLKAVPSLSLTHHHLLVSGLPFATICKGWQCPWWVVDHTHQSFESNQAATELH